MKVERPQPQTPRTDGERRLLPGVWRRGQPRDADKGIAHSIVAHRQSLGKERGRANPAKILQFAEAGTGAEEGQRHLGITKRPELTQ
jgi:hypothetical protein